MSEPKSIQVKQHRTLHEKQKLLRDIRHEIKKKRLLLDEGRERFGMDDMSQLMKVKNTSEVKGYPFKVGKTNSCLEDTKIALKIVPIETKYEKHEHPCQLENIFLRELTENIVNNNISPHVTYYLGTQKVSNKSRALKQLNLKRLEVEEKIRSHSNMLISEFVEGGSLDNWVFNTYEDDEEITDEQWKSIVFQLIYTIAVIQHYYRMMHNDFHYGNILIDNTLTPGGYFVYEIQNKRFYLPNTGIIPKIWDS
jgi:serine/threonine protein kinase